MWEEILEIPFEEVLGLGPGSVAVSIWFVLIVDHHVTSFRNLLGVSWNRHYCCKLLYRVGV